MKTLKLKRLELLNFKGIRTLVAETGSDVTVVKGRNATGKTTMFDAFVWLLFGKDSSGRQEFDIKTLDAAGEVIPRQPHEVEATLETGGETIRLRKRYTEKWTKKRGSATEEFTGHETEYFWNDVPLTKKEYTARVSEICPEETFRMITNPAWFPRMESKKQKELLFEMAGEVSDAEVAAGREDFENLLRHLSGKSMEDFRKETGAKKRIIKGELEGLPDRIDERMRDIAQYEGTDFAAVAREIESREQELASLDDRLTRASAHAKAVCKTRNDIQTRIIANSQTTMKMRSERQRALGAEHYAAQARREEAESRLRTVESAIPFKKNLHAVMLDDLRRMEERRNKLRAEWDKIIAMRLEYGEDAFRCPTCGQFLPDADTEKRKQEMQEAFNINRVRLMEENRRKGMECNKDKLARQQAAADALMKEVDDATRLAMTLKEEIAAIAVPPLPDEDAVLKSLEGDAAYEALVQETKALEAELDAAASATSTDEDTAGLSQRRRELTAEVAELKTTMARKELIAANRRRIAEIEGRIRTLSEELAQLEGLEFTAAEFQKARTEAVMERINALFGMTTFRFYTQQVNGGEQEKCEAMVGGVPYSSLNNAARINAGLDIINAICRHEGVCAPIFIDNAEGLNEPLHTEGQQIRLYVTDDEKLNIQTL